MPDTVIISGGSRGLGWALTKSFLDRGCNVATFSRSPSPAIAELEKSHPNTLLFRALDAAHNQDVRQFVIEVAERFGTVDALVNNAGLASDRVLALTTDEQIDAMLDVNLKAAIVLAREASRLMLTSGRGSIVNISSIIAQRGFSGLAVYAATKAGMIGMTKSLARELGPRNIRVNAVAPGYLATEMSAALGEQQRQQIIRRTPLGRLGTVDDVVPTVEFLLSPHSQFITGQVFVVDGGASI